MSEGWQDRRNREDLEVKTAIASFPDEFPLYGMPKCKFRVAQMPWSFYSNDSGVQLVVQIWSTRETWMDYARCTPNELRERMRLK
jgi:hypothetical protein